MGKFPLNDSGISASRLVYGCMGLGGSDWSNKTAYTPEDVKQAHEAVEAALSIGINMFDHANIYKSGKAEQIFGEVLKERKDLRDRIILQSKCGIRFADDLAPFTRFDFSKDYILDCVDGILSRLGTDYLDILLLHRPDALVEPEEVAEAFHHLKASGKVKSFGVSNMSAGQIRLLQSCLDVPIVVNQLEMSLYRHNWVDVGINVNRDPAANDIFPEGTLEFCRLENIQIQAWGPLAQGIYTGRPLTDQSETVRATAQKVQAYAEQKGTTAESILLAWLMRHPAGIQPVIGTKTPERILACKDAERITLTREEWYDLWITARGAVMP
ncbi:aldo/keto reductase [Alicyclobacillus dauci]|uniref:Aldo/keto reductase n=1 Tax=Alicyclobacillus dauci TaxID=1475485 RepID=A0ABY6Z655_9BACL|nr:aldo/keto reductase [Alicyclobacillus dauci]WAH38092.1 aldo/keto reductase [Alicyclobacillus dauci]